MDAERAVRSVELIFNGCGESCAVGGADLQWRAVRSVEQVLLFYTFPMQLRRCCDMTS